MPLFGDRSKRIQWLSEHPKRRFAQVLAFGAFVSVFGLLRFIFLYKNYPDESSVISITAVVAASILLPLLTTIYPSKPRTASPYARQLVFVFLIAVVPGVPFIEGWTNLFGSYTTHHWLEVPADLACFLWGALMILRSTQRRMWKTQPQ
jgi:hypothetical protein